MPSLRDVLTSVVPAWVRWLVLALAFAFVALFFEMRGKTIEGEKHLAYLAKQTEKASSIKIAQLAVASKIEAKGVVKIQKIFIQGETIEKQVPIYVTAGDDLRFGVNVGFVRSHRASTLGESAGGPADSDREASPVSLSTVAQVDATNNKNHLACIEQVELWKEFYGKLEAIRQ